MMSVPLNSLNLRQYFFPRQSPLNSEDDIERGDYIDRQARLLTFRDHDHHCLLKFAGVQLNTEGIIPHSAYDANDWFPIIRKRKLISWNLKRPSSMSNGIRRDGSYVANSPVAIPSKLIPKYPNFEEHIRSKPDLMSELNSPGVEAFMKRYGIPKGGLNVENWKLPADQDPVTNDNWEKYASHELFPYLKAAANGSYFVLRGQSEATILRSLKPFPDLYARLARLKTLELFCVPTQHGVLVAAPWRFYLSLFWFFVSLSFGIAAAIHRREDWYDSMESFFTVTILTALTLPGIAALLIQEPDLVRNALRGKKTLSSDQKVASWFGLVEKDYAAAAMSLKGSVLVSEKRGCFLSGKANPALSGDGYLVSAETLQHVGILIGRAIHRRVWEENNKITEELDFGVSHLVDEVATDGPLRKWAAGKTEERLVGSYTPIESCSWDTANIM